MIPLERPNVIRVAARANQRVIESKVSAVHFGRFLEMALFQEKGRVGMSSGLHPRPWLTIRELVIQFDGFAQMLKGLVIVLTAIFDFSIQHGRSHGQRLCTLAIIDNAGLWDQCRCLLEERSLLQGSIYIPCSRIGSSLGVKRSCRRDSV